MLDCKRVIGLLITGVWLKCLQFLIIRYDVNTDVFFGKIDVNVSAVNVFDSMFSLSFLFAKVRIILKFLFVTSLN